MDDSTPIIDVTARPAHFVPADDFWALLRRRKGLIALFWILSLVAAGWWLLARPRLFEAESRIMIVRTGAGGGPVSEAELASEIELIRDAGHLNKTAAKQAPNPSDAQVHELERQIESSLTVAPAGKSNLVAIQYRGSDPTAAARIVNQIVELYLADRRLVFPVSARAEPAASAQDALSTFDALNHGNQLNTELQIRVERRIELESRIAELKAQIRDHQESSSALRSRLASLPERIQSRTRTRTTADPSSRQVEETEIVNPLKQQLQAELLKNDTSIPGLRARLAETSTALRETKAAEDRASALSLERDSLERRAVDARGGGQLANPNDSPNLRSTLVNRAEPPYAPLPRHTALWLPVALLGALALALIIAWLIDQFDKPIYTRDDFERASGVPPMDFAPGDGV